MNISEKISLMFNDKGFNLNPNYQTEKTLNISNNLSLTADEKVMQDIEHDSGPNDFIFI